LTNFSSEFVNFEQCRFESTQITESKFERGNMNGSIFIEAELENCRFNYMEFEDCSIHEAVEMGCKFLPEIEIPIEYSKRNSRNCLWRI